MSTNAPLRNPLPTNPPSSLAPILRKLWRKLGAAEQDALLALPHRVEKLEADEYIVREGSKATHSCLVLSGFAFRQKLTVDGLRSISTVHMRGDVVDLQNSLLGRADHSVQALTRATVAFIPREAIIALAFRLPNVGLAMWYETLVDASISREWILNMARRDAQARIAHLLCELGVRVEALGLGERCHYDFPMTQGHLADATGLTPVHVNRSLKALTERGLITEHVNHIAVVDWCGLQAAGEFDDAYLHLPSEGARALKRLPSALSRH